MHSDYDQDQDRRDTAEENHDRALDRRDRTMDNAPAGTAEPNLETEALGRLAEDPSIHEIAVDGLPPHLRDDAPQWRCSDCKRLSVALKDGDRCGMPQPDGSFCAGTFSTVDVLPRDLDDHPAARDQVERLARSYDSIEVDRLPPIGALHWLLRCHRGQTVYVCRVTADGRLLSVQR